MTSELIPVMRHNIRSKARGEVRYSTVQFGQLSHSTRKDDNLKVFNFEKGFRFSNKIPCIQKYVIIRGSTMFRSGIS